VDEYRGLHSFAFFGSMMMLFSLPFALQVGKINRRRSARLKK